MNLVGMLRFLWLPLATTAAFLPRQSCPSVPCANLTPPSLEGAKITTFTATEKAGSSGGAGFSGPTSTIDVCEIDIHITHDSAFDDVRALIWLPLSPAWNGRFQGTGGGGMVAGNFESALFPAASSGYACGSTDAGVPTTFSDGSSWADNDVLVANFAHRSIHEMTLLGKALAAQHYYGGEKQVEYSYWNGCSTGGRQGFMEVQRYPEDYQGVYAAAPAINWDLFHVAMLWPYVVQRMEGEFVPTQVFDSITAAAIVACDGDDGGQDALISDPEECVFNAATVDGITDSQAKIWNMIRTGPVDTEGNSLWTGIIVGTTYSSLATQTPFFLAQAWIEAFVMGEDPGFSAEDITYETFASVFTTAHEKFGELIGTSQADISAFFDAGGKLLSWHGWADQLIFANGTVHYWKRVRDTMEDVDIDDFFRLFMAPGVQHCGGGDGPTPTDPMAALVAWVESGVVPDTLPASGPAGDRNLCLHPKVLVYTGKGDLGSAESWGCE